LNILDMAFKGVVAKVFGRGGTQDHWMHGWYRLLLALTCSAAQAAPIPPGHNLQTMLPTSYKVVLVAGDNSLPVFDNAVAGVEARLLDRGAVRMRDIQRLSATASVLQQRGVRSATLDHILGAIAAMRPRPGQGCLVFATSHGGHGKGLWLADGPAYLSPAALNAALDRGCPGAATVVVISACFSGSFALAPMAQANRVILTAARPDRTSFGCGAGRVYTVYDDCLLHALETPGTWRQAYDVIKACVAAEEVREQAVPSEPQAAFGEHVAALALPGKQ
jgi:hypothetical protein